jgi:hypothetical protein
MYGIGSRIEYGIGLPGNDKLKILVLFQDHYLLNEPLQELLGTAIRHAFGSKCDIARTLFKLSLSLIADLHDFFDESKISRCIKIHSSM